MSDLWSAIPSGLQLFVYKKLVIAIYSTWSCKYTRIMRDGIEYHFDLTIESLECKLPNDDAEVDRFQTCVTMSCF